MSKTFFPELSDYIAIVCHDAGATNILIPIITHLSPKNLNVFVRGPAKNLWKQTYPKMKFSNSFETAIHKADKLVSGTGWASNLEHNARKYALKNNIYSIAIL